MINKPEDLIVLLSSGLFYYLTATFKVEPVNSSSGCDERWKLSDLENILPYLLFSMACRISALMSSICSKPTEIRISPGVMPTTALSSSVSLE